MLRVGSLPYVVLFCFGASAAHAAETDAFTTRYTQSPNALPAIEAEIEQRVTASVDQLNREQRGNCYWGRLESILSARLRRSFFGMIEDFIENSGKVARFFPTISESIYRDLSFFNRAPLVAGAWVNIGIGGHFHYNDPAVPEGPLVIGADKFGHFLDEGYSYYRMVSQWGLSEVDTFAFGVFTEKTIYGTMTGGVFSYGDLAANYDGYRFWTDLLGGSGRSKFVSCSNGQWKRESKIDLTSYVSIAWDEGMNCNVYRSESFGAPVLSAIQLLERSTGKRYACPVYPAQVNVMTKRYPGTAAHVIHPDLLR